MPIEEAAVFFEAIPGIHRHLSTLVDVGLGYVRLGQPAPTLSGGEAQRVKLASELQKRSTGRTVYVLDEPTTGLHFEDIRKLLRVLDGLVDKGNTVIVIEHNLDVIKTADWIIDMGPEGGHKGGTVVAVGTPEELAETPDSYTGQWLRRVLGLSGEADGGTSATDRAATANGSDKSARNGSGRATKATAPAKSTATKATATKPTPAKATPTKATAPAKTTATKATKATKAASATTARGPRKAVASGR
jgi:excinuclease ABC subunit A